ncbi:hypothetical protein DA2_3600 [Desulfovibrio sp. A2]|nr:hypothetical protein DA2_3600 [Desulfovibrio sp. A2]
MCISCGGKRTVNSLGILHPCAECGNGKVGGAEYTLTTPCGGTVHGLTFLHTRPARAAQSGVEQSV